MPSFLTTITSISVIVARFIGELEVLPVIGSELHTNGAFGDAVQGLSFSNLGFNIIGLCWLVFVIVYETRRINELDVLSAVPTQGAAHSPSITCPDK